MSLTYIKWYLIQLTTNYFTFISTAVYCRS